MAAVLRRLVQLRHGSTLTSKSASSVVGIPKISAPKVLDNVVQMTAIDEDDGQRFPIKGILGQTLMRTLVQSGLKEADMHRLDDLSACSGHCEVSVSNEWLEKLPPRSEDELVILQRNAVKGRKVDIHTRLGCQIVLNKDLDGMYFAMPEAQPWRTN